MSLVAALEAAVGEAARYRLAWLSARSRAATSAAVAGFVAGERDDARHELDVLRGVAQDLDERLTDALHGQGRAIADRDEARGQADALRAQLAGLECSMAPDLPLPWVDPSGAADIHIDMKGADS